MFDTISSLLEQPSLPEPILSVKVTAPTIIMPPEALACTTRELTHAYALLGLYLHSIKPSKPTTITTPQSKSLRPVISLSRLITFFRILSFCSFFALLGWFFKIKAFLIYHIYIRSSLWHIQLKNLKGDLF